MVKKKNHNKYERTSISHAEMSGFFDLRFNSFFVFFQNQNDEQVIIFLFLTQWWIDF
jgi:hypothetical protein